MPLLQGFKAVVTGAGHPLGIGRATAALFMQHGASVVALDREFPPAGLPEDMLAMTVDVSDARACHAAVSRAAEHMNGIDVIVNNAGIVAATRLMQIKEGEFSRMLEVNLLGTFNVTQAAVPFLQQSDKGASIVNLGSIAAQRGGGLLGGSHYAASKGGVISFTKASARELGSLGIRANAVTPGIIQTGMIEGKYDADRTRAICDTIPLGRFGTAAEVAGVILFLASPLASYLTGTVIDVNGGFHIH